MIKVEKDRSFESDGLDSGEVVEVGRRSRDGLSDPVVRGLVCWSLSEVEHPMSRVEDGEEEGVEDTEDGMMIVSEVEVEGDSKRVERERSVEEWDPR